MPKHTKQEQAESLESLRELLKPGDTVFCVLRHVSSSGMTRVIQLVVFKDGSPRYIGWSAATVLGLTYDRKREGVKVEGCGMDMGFHLVYNLSRVLFPEGFGIESKEHVRPATREEAASLKHFGHTFYGRNGDPSGWDDDGGYALTSRWL